MQDNHVQNLHLKMFDLVYNSSTDDYSLYVDGIKKADGIRGYLPIADGYDSTGDHFYWIYKSFELTLGFSDNPTVNLTSTTSYYTFYSYSLSDLINSVNHYFSDMYYYSDTPYPCMMLKKQDFHFSNTTKLIISAFNLVSDDFKTNLYPELLNNYEQASMAQSFLNDTDPQKELDPDYWTDKYLAFCKFVEEYNKNVLLLRSTRKVDASVSGSISQSGHQQQIDLSSLNANTARIADNLQILDDNQNVKSITKVLDDKNNDQQVVVTTVEKAPYNPLLEDDEF